MSGSEPVGHAGVTVGVGFVQNALRERGLDLAGDAVDERLEGEVLHRVEEALAEREAAARVVADVDVVLA